MEYLERVADIELKERLDAIGVVYMSANTLMDVTPIVWASSTLVSIYLLVF